MAESPKHGLPDFRDVSKDMFFTALSRGWRDIRRAPLFAFLFAGVYVVLGWLMVGITQWTGQTYWLVFAAIGFPLIAPFAAVGFYEVSRRIEAGQPLRWKDVLGVVLRQSNRQLPSIGAIILVIFLFWFFLAHMIFALFLGLSAMTNVSSSFDVYLTTQGLAMLAVGTIVGAGFATLIYMITVISFPLLLDREVDFVTAMITSFTYVASHKVPMFLWATFIAVLTFLSLLPGFLGLFLTLPLLGHATWHLYDILAYGNEPNPA